MTCQIAAPTRSRPQVAAVGPMGTTCVRLGKCPKSLTMSQFPLAATKRNDKRIGRAKVYGVPGMIRAGEVSDWSGTNRRWLSPLQNPNSTSLANKPAFAILFDSSDLTGAQIDWRA